jgi:hypothetical protein
MPKVKPLARRVTQTLAVAVVLVGLLMASVLTKLVAQAAQAS